MNMSQQDCCYGGRLYCSSCRQLNSAVGNWVTSWCALDLQQEALVWWSMHSSAVAPLGWSEGHLRDFSTHWASKRLDLVASSIYGVNVSCQSRMVLSSLGVELNLLAFAPIVMVGWCLASLVSLENVDTSDLPAFSESFHTTLQFWMILTTTYVFGYAPRKGLSEFPFGGVRAVARIVTSSTVNAEITSSGRLSETLLM